MTILLGSECLERVWLRKRALCQLWVCRQTQKVIEKFVQEGELYPSPLSLELWVEIKLTKHPDRFPVYIYQHLGNGFSERERHNGYTLKWVQMSTLNLVSDCLDHASSWLGEMGSSDTWDKEKIRRKDQSQNQGERFVEMLKKLSSMARLSRRKRLSLLKRRKRRKRKKSLTKKSACPAEGNWVC